MKKAKKRSRKARSGEPERFPPALASELGLMCRQLRQEKPGHFERCTNRAVGFLPKYGDSCDRCARGRFMIRYAVERTARVKAA